jgi:hypothetical protein
MSAQFQVPIPYLVGKAVDRLKEIIGQIGEWIIKEKNVIKKLIM